MCAGLDANWLKRAFLAGIDLTDDSGAEYPDELWDVTINMAREIIETEVGTSLCEVKSYDERYDATFGDWGRAFQTELNHGSVRSITAVEFKVADVSTVKIPLSWVYIRDVNQSIIEIIPGLQAPQFINFTGAYGGFYLNGRHFDARIPAYLRVQYTAGFEEPTYPIPALAKQCIGWIASMLPLDTAGDLIAGAGIASFSISMDGLSQSIGTTSSATNSGYGARVLSYTKQLDKFLPVLRRQFRGMPMHGL